MDANEFIGIIREIVVNDSVRFLQSNLIKPPGRKPSEKLLAMSTWYNNLNDGDKSVVIQIINKSVEMGVFEFLCVLDGVRAIEGEEKGELKLYYEKGNQKILLNDINKVNLHELL
ncbi:MAG: hypothetical protein ABUT20_57750 [Bacteroidota bacterium]